MSDECLDTLIMGVRTLADLGGIGFEADEAVGHLCELAR